MQDSVTHVTGRISQVTGGFYRVCKGEGKLRHMSEENFFEEHRDLMGYSTFGLFLGFFENSVLPRYRGLEDPNARLSRLCDATISRGGTGTTE